MRKREDELDDSLARTRHATERRSEADPKIQRLIELQRSVGNDAVASMLALPVQRQKPQAADAPVDLRLHLLDLKGISGIKCPDPTPPWVPKAAEKASKKEPADDDHPNIWNLDFDLDADPDSPLGRELAREERERQILSGGKSDGGTPLALQLSNTAVNILANTDKGQELVNKLHLDHFTVVLDPTSGNYGVMARFTFGK
jgi:hypothetical protein